jgi:hypothetical protein
MIRSFVGPNLGCMVTGGARSEGGHESISRGS